jgi:hypothetical protein
MPLRFAPSHLSHLRFTPDNAVWIVLRAGGGGSGNAITRRSELPDDLLSLATGQGEEGQRWPRLTICAGRSGEPPGGLGLCCVASGGVCGRYGWDRERPAGRAGLSTKLVRGHTTTARGLVPRLLRHAQVDGAVPAKRLAVHDCGGFTRSWRLSKFAKEPS